MEGLLKTNSKDLYTKNPHLYHQAVSLDLELVCYFFFW